MQEIGLEGSSFTILFFIPYGTVLLKNRQSIARIFRLGLLWVWSVAGFCQGVAPSSPYLIILNTRGVQYNNARLRQIFHVGARGYVDAEGWFAFSKIPTLLRKEARIIHFSHGF